MAEWTGTKRDVEELLGYSAPSSVVSIDRRQNEDPSWNIIKIWDADEGKYLYDRASVLEFMRGPYHLAKIGEWDTAKEATGTLGEEFDTGYLKGQQDGMVYEDDYFKIGSTTYYNPRSIERHMRDSERYAKVLDLHENYTPVKDLQSQLQAREDVTVDWLEDQIRSGKITGQYDEDLGFFVDDKFLVETPEGLTGIDTIVQIYQADKAPASSSNPNELGAVLSRIRGRVGSDQVVSTSDAIELASSLGATYDPDTFKWTFGPDSLPDDSAFFKQEKPASEFLSLSQAETRLEGLTLQDYTSEEFNQLLGGDDPIIPSEVLDGERLVPVSYFSELPDDLAGLIGGVLADDAEEPISTGSDATVLFSAGGTTASAFNKWIDATGGNISTLGRTDDKGKLVGMSPDANVAFRDYRREEALPEAPGTQLTFKQQNVTFSEAGDFAREQGVDIQTLVHFEDGSPVGVFQDELGPVMDWLTAEPEGLPPHLTFDQVNYTEPELKKYARDNNIPIAELAVYDKGQIIGVNPDRADEVFDALTAEPAPEVRPYKTAIELGMKTSDFTAAVLSGKLEGYIDPNTGSLKGATQEAFDKYQGALAQEAIDAESATLQALRDKPLSGRIVPGDPIVGVEDIIGFGIPNVTTREDVIKLFGDPAEGDLYLTDKLSGVWDELAGVDGPIAVIPGVGDQIVAIPGTGDGVTGDLLDLDFDLISTITDVDITTVDPLPHTNPWDDLDLNTSGELSPADLAQETLNNAVQGEGTARDALDVLSGGDLNDFDVDITHTLTPDLVDISPKDAETIVPVDAPLIEIIGGRTDPVTRDQSVDLPVQIPELAQLASEQGRPQYSARTQKTIARLRSQGASEQDIASAAESLERQQRSGLVNYDPSFVPPGGPASGEPADFPTPGIPAAPYNQGYAEQSANFRRFLERQGQPGATIPPGADPPVRLDDKPAAVVRRARPNVERRTRSRRRRRQAGLDR